MELSYIQVEHNGGDVLAEIGVKACGFCGVRSLVFSKMCFQKDVIRNHKNSVYP